MESLVRTKTLAFNNSYYAPIIFLKYTKWVFNMQRTWHSPKMTPTMYGP